MLSTILRTVLFYFVIIFAMRLMGKRQIGDLQPSDLVITILISEIAAMPIQDLQMPVWHGIAATLTLVLLELAVSLLVMKSLELRKLFYGSSAIIIKDGKIDQKLLRRLRITVPDLLEVLRNQEVFDLGQVAYAILETNGQISILLKPEFQTASVNDMNGIKTSSGMPCLVVSDGKFLKKAMQSVGFTRDDVKQELNKNNLKLKDVFIMTVQEDGKVTVVRKEQN